MNWDEIVTVDRLISLVASLGTCVAAYATFRTVREMSKQREATYQPELVISSANFEARTGHLSGKLPIHWRHPERADDVSALDANLKLKMLNLGFGAATNVHLMWEFDIEGTVALANELAQKALIPSFFEYESGTLKFRSGELGSGGSFWKNQQHVVVDYLLPASGDAEAFNLSLPLAYTHLCSAIVFFAGKIQGESSFATLPRMVATVSYSSIGGVPYTSIIALSVELNAIYGQGESFSGTLLSARMLKRI